MMWGYGHLQDSPTAAFQWEQLEGLGGHLSHGGLDAAPQVRQEDEGAGWDPDFIRSNFPTREPSFPPGQEQQPSLSSTCPTGIFIGATGGNPSGSQGPVEGFHPLAPSIQVVSVQTSMEREALSLPLGRLRLEIHPLRRADSALPQTLQGAALRVPALLPGFLPFGPPLLTLEEAPGRADGGQMPLRVLSQERGTPKSRLPLACPDEGKPNWKRRCSFFLSLSLSFLFFFFLPHTCTPLLPACLPVLPSPSSVTTMVSRGGGIL